MSVRIENQNVIEIKALSTPREVKGKLPLTEEAASLVVYVLAEDAIARTVVAGREVFDAETF